MNIASMTREEAISAIQSNRPTSGYTMLCEALDMAVAALREQEERRWIPASEPPKDSDHVLVCTKHRKPFKARYYPDRKRWDVSGSVVITHWMPLPEPPKEEKP